MIELTNIRASPSFSAYVGALQDHVLQELNSPNCLNQIHLGVVFDGQFAAVTFDSSRYRDEYECFDLEQWEETIDVMLSGLGATFAAIAVPVYFPRPLAMDSNMACHNVIAMHAVERLFYCKTGLAVFSDGETLLCSGRWNPMLIDSPSDDLITAVRQHVTHQG